MLVESFGGMVLKRGNKNTLEGNLTLYHFVHHKSHID